MGRRKSSIRHPNFKDLNPAYDLMRYQNAMRVAEIWKQELGSKLKEKYKAQHRKNFNEFIQAGNSLSYNQIRDLKTTLKGDYIINLLNQCEKTDEWT